MERTPGFYWAQYIRGDGPEEQREVVQIVNWGASLEDDIEGQRVVLRCGKSRIYNEGDFIGWKEVKEPKTARKRELATA